MLMILEGRLARISFMSAVNPGVSVLTTKLTLRPPLLITVKYLLEVHRVQWNEDTQSLCLFDISAETSSK